MAAITTYSEPEKKRLFKRVTKDIKKVEKIHGVEETRWAMNKLTKDRKDEAALKQKVKDAEEELERLKTSA